MSNVRDAVFPDREIAEAGPKVGGEPFTVPERPVKTWDKPQNETDTLAPMIFEAWYVIAKITDVDRTLKSIKVLGEPLVYYRTEDGRPTVLDNRCAHRRFPLSKGTLKGDAIQCGYHGFTYAETGRCIWAPGVDVEGRRQDGFAFGVRSYPCAERGPWLWVWMGKPERADPANIPLPDDDMPPERTACGYKMNPANYMLLIENLHDQSHLHFLHGAGDIAHAGVLPVELPAPPDGVAWRKVTDNTETGLLGTLCGDEAGRLVRIEDYAVQYGPALTYGYQARLPLPGDDGPAPRPAKMLIIHATTPLDHRNTHQFFAVSSSDPLTIGVDAMLHNAQDVVFEQDVEAMQYMQAHIDGDVRPGRVEFNMIWDRVGLKIRRILKDMKRRELDEA